MIQLADPRRAKAVPQWSRAGAAVAEVVPYEGVEMTDNSGADAGGGRGCGRRCQCGVRWGLSAEDDGRW
jgi:hypothetical protein